MSPPILETPRLYLYPLDVPAALSLFEDPAGAGALLPAPPAPGWPSAELLETLPGYAEAAEADPSLVGWGAWLLVLRGLTALVGDAGFHAPPDEAGEVELAYGLAPAYRRRGLATEAVGALVAHAFADPRVTAVVAVTVQGNLASARVLERCGFAPVEADEAHIRWRLART